MLYVKLTRSNGDPIYINLDNVQTMERMPDGTTIEWAADFSYSCIKETPEEILALAAKS